MYHYRGVDVETHPMVYKPAEDTQLLIDAVISRDLKEKKLLDVGTGTGIIGVHAAMKGALVVATDTNPRALKCASENARKNGVKMAVIESDLFERVSSTYDVVVFNPPYLPEVPEDRKAEEALRRAWAGGPKGSEILNTFLGHLTTVLNPGGYALVAASSLTKGAFKGLQGLEIKAISTQKFLFEEITIFEVKYVESNKKR
jgi:release factor glutamine methyltransferase